MRFNEVRMDYRVKSIAPSTRLHLRTSTGLPIALVSARLVTTLDLLSDYPQNGGLSPAEVPALMPGKPESNDGSKYESFD